MRRAEELTEKQWSVIEHLFPELQPHEDARGRPPAGTRVALRQSDAVSHRHGGVCIRALLGTTPAHSHY